MVVSQSTCDVAPGYSECTLSTTWEMQVPWPVVGHSLAGAILFSEKQSWAETHLWAPVSVQPGTEQCRQIIFLCFDYPLSKMGNIGLYLIVREGK